ncbi:MAG: SRPBCC family protein [Opitutaceae bacterium]|nr:SRPBCC family protein [Opitutaceae bacterium]
MDENANPVVAFCRGQSSPRNYALWGAGLFFAKWNIDRLIAAAFFNQAWLPWNYFLADPAVTAWEKNRNLALTLAALSLPFIAIGVVLTVRRLRDAGWPLWLVTLFFVPFVNLAFFLTLCLLPTKPAETADGTKAPEAWWRRIFHFDSRLGSAAAAIMLTTVLMVALVTLGTAVLKNYGWGLFVGVPFVGGFLGAWLHGLATPRRLAECIVVALLVVAIAGTALVLLAVEGVICVLMAAPLAIPLALFGAVVGYAVQRERWNRRDGTGASLYSAAWVLLPLLLVVESRAPQANPLLSVTTSEEIAAPPDIVWRHVVEFSALPPPRELIFRSGIAYPVRARIEGRGVGAVRHCEFSTGPFVEPITAWDEPRWLAFDVTAQPHPMRELSPYRTLHPPHLEGFFLSRRGEFRLIELPGGRTRLDGTTWYEQRLWPAPYWQAWSDWLVHSIHSRVLRHIKAEAEHDLAH